MDGQVTTLTYTNWDDTWFMLSQVTDPCNHTTTLNYDEPPSGYGPVLASITDAAGLTSSLKYSDNNGLRALCTPYGTNSFTFLENDSYDLLAIHINELGLRDHLYMFVDDDQTSQILNSYAAWRPSTTNNGFFAFPNTFDSEDMKRRDTFYWGPLQYPNLPSGFLSALNNTTSPTIDPTLTATDYLQARQRHWLKASSGHRRGQPFPWSGRPVPAARLRARSPGTTMTAKPAAAPRREGTMNLPLFKAWKLPTGESRFIRYERNALGWPTRTIETYTDLNGHLNVRTNTSVISANNIDVLCVTNALGIQVVSNIFNANHSNTYASKQG